MTTDQDSNEVPLFERPPGYRSYVLRLWQERSGQSPLDVWRFSLEDPQTDQRHGFADLGTHGLAEGRNGEDAGNRRRFGPGVPHAAGRLDCVGGMGLGRGAFSCGRLPIGSAIYFTCGICRRIGRVLGVRSP